MGIVVLFVLQLAVALAGFVVLWRRLEQTRAELDEMRQRLHSLEGEKEQRRRPKRAAPDAALTETVVSETPYARAARAWSGMARTRQRTPAAAPAISGDLRIGATLGIAALFPALAFVFGGGGAAPVCAGLLVAAGMAGLALREAWGAAAWAACATALVWSAVGFITGVALTDTEVFSAALAATGIAGCAFAFLRRLAPGALLATAMAASALLLGAQSDMIGPAGAAYALIVLSAALAGAVNLRLEGLHVGAFLASLFGLFVLSGQPSAAVWFTPASGLSGAAFFAIAAVRTPQLGPRGVTLAGAGVLGPFTAVATLAAAQYGLAGGGAAGGGFLLIALAFAGLLVVTARPRAERLASLGATLWILAIATAAALGAAVVTAAPEPIAPPALACFALSATLIDERYPHLVWRTISAALALAAATLAALNVQSILTEASIWPGAITTGLALALPASLFAAAAWRAHVKSTSAPEGLFEFLAVALAIATADLVVRLAFSDGAVKLNPVNFVEAGAHVTVWLLAALGITLRDSGRPRAAYTGASATLGAAAIAGVAISALLWFTPYWQNRSGLHPFAPPPLGFLAPAALFAAHWALLRARGSRVRTRVAFAACTLTLASAATLAIATAGRAPPWALPLGAALAFGAAIAVNFAPGVLPYAGRRRRDTRQRA